MTLIPTDHLSSSKSKTLGPQDLLRTLKTLEKKEKERPGKRRIWKKKKEKSVHKSKRKNENRRNKQKEKKEKEWNT